MGVCWLPCPSYKPTRPLQSRHMPRLLRIGDFSQLAQVSTRMLRHYDQIGLLKPASVDAISDYRLYALDQLPRLNRILALKDLGLSLDQIADVLRDDVPTERLHAMLDAKQREIEQHVRAEQDRMWRVRARLTRIEHEGQRSEHDVVLKISGACTIVSTRRVLSSMHDVLNARREMLLAAHDVVRRYALEPCNLPAAELVLYHNDEYVDENMDIEAGVCVHADDLAGHIVTGNVSVRQLAAQPSLAAVVHRGTLWQARDTLTSLYVWLGENGFASAGPCCEWHLSGYENDLVTHDQLVVMEFHVPVTPLAS